MKHKKFTTNIEPTIPEETSYDKLIRVKRLAKEEKWSDAKIEAIDYLIHFEMYEQIIESRKSGIIGGISEEKEILSRNSDNDNYNLHTWKR